MMRRLLSLLVLLLCFVAASAKQMTEMPLSRRLNTFKSADKALTITTNGDTIFFYPEKYKLPDNAVLKDLLKRLPGVGVDPSGRVSVNNRTINQIRVDGQKYFLQDMQVAIRTLMPDVIESIQVYDQKSDLSELTGVEDGATLRVLNVVYKKTRQGGLLGDATAAVGIDNEGRYSYSPNVRANYKTNQTQTHFLSEWNNGAGEIYSGSIGNFGLNSRLGVSNFSVLSKNLTVGGDGVLTLSSASPMNYAENQNYTQNTTSINNSTSSNTVKSAALRMELIWKIGRGSTLIVQPDLSMGKSLGHRQSDSKFISSESEIQTIDTTTSVSVEQMASMNVIFNHRFASRVGRLLTLNLEGSMQKSDAENTTTKLRLPSNQISGSLSKNGQDDVNSNVGVSYVEPLWNVNHVLELKANVRTGDLNEDRKTFRNEVGEREFTLFDSTFSNKYSKAVYNEIFQLNYRFENAALMCRAGLSVLPSKSTTSYFYYNGESWLHRRQSQLEYAPNFLLRYRFKNDNFVRLVFDGYSSQPTLDEKRPLRVNSLFSEKVWNEQLKAAFQNNLTIDYNAFFRRSRASLTSSFYVKSVSKMIVSNTVFDEVGKQYIQMVNLDKTLINGSALVGFSIPVIGNFLHLNTLSAASYASEYSYYDSHREPVYDTDANLRLGKLNSRESKQVLQKVGLTGLTRSFEFGLRGYVKYRDDVRKSNTVQEDETYDLGVSANLNLLLPHGWMISNELNGVDYRGYTNGQKGLWLWNAQIDKSIFGTKGSLFLKLNDILQQYKNTSERRTSSSLILNQNNNVTAYLLVGLRYRFAKIPGK